MKSPTSKPIASPPPPSWPARITHETICAVVTGIFCVVELLVFVTEWRTKKFSRRQPPLELAPNDKPILRSRRASLAEK